MSHLSLVHLGPGAPAESGRYEISGDLALVVGRDASCDIRIDESHDVVSRRHVTIRWGGESLVAHDSSSNGLFVNGQRVSGSAPIHDEDELQLGTNGPRFIVALDPKPVKAPPPAKQTKLLAPTRPPQPVIHVAAEASPPVPPTAATEAASAQAALQDMARGGKQLLSGAAASIKRSIEERMPDKDSPTNEALQDIARGGKKLLSGAAASIKQSMEERSAGADLSPPSSIKSPSPNSQGFFMLSRIVVSLYKVILEIALWLVLLAGVIGGWKNGGFTGALVGLVVVAILSAVLFGAFLVLGDIRQSVRAIEARLNAKD